VRTVRVAGGYGAGCARGALSSLSSTRCLPLPMFGVGALQADDALASCDLVGVWFSWYSTRAAHRPAAACATHQVYLGTSQLTSASTLLISQLALRTAQSL
jgi:hypothetical protein